MSRDALVVGINNYQQLPSLQSPSRDAEAIAQVLEEYGNFGVRRLPAVKDKKNDFGRVGQTSKVTQTQLEEALAQLFKPEGEHIPDTALFYFSGHGLRKSRGIHEGFLATSYVNSNDDKWGVSLKWLRELLQQSPVHQQIVWLDCCYSGEVLNFAEADPGSRGEGQTLFLLAASREFEAAYEKASGQHGVFTAVLKDGLDPRRSPKGEVTSDTLIEFLKQELKGATQRSLWYTPSREILLTGQRGEIFIPTLEGICPYKGLRHFDTEDALYFHGREVLTEQLLDQVKVGKGNFLAVLGASGSGKSSVVRAGLLYHLQQGSRVSQTEQWQIRIFTLGEQPLESLAVAFLDQGTTDIDRAEQLKKAEQAIAEGAEGLARLIKVFQAPRTVLFIDQFEEVFTLYQNLAERQQFFACLLGALEQIEDKLCLILAMRADFLGKCSEQEYSGLVDKIQSHLVTVKPMTAKGLEQAIREPAKQVGLRVDDNLVTQILTDLSVNEASLSAELPNWEPGSLPLLEYTLEQLWHYRTLDRLTLDSYIRLGGVKQALEKRADVVYQSFSTKEQQAAKQIFLALTQLGEGTEDTRRRVRKQDLVSEHYPEVLIDKVAQRLADERLIVTSKMAEKSEASRKVVVVDVAHEALIRHWPLLRAWIDENRDSLRQKHKIEAAAEEWRLQGKAKDYLLQGKPLKEAKAFQEEKAGNLMLSRLAEEFIQKSIQRRRNTRTKLIRLSWIPLGLAVILGIVGVRDLELKWSPDNGSKSTGSISPEQVQPPQILVKPGSDLKGRNLSYASLSYANLSGADLSGADLSNANLNDANLSSANLSNANLIIADLGYADLSNANLSSANLSGADLSGADLSGAKNLTLEQVKSATNWQQATYDEEFRTKLGLE